MTHGNSTMLSGRPMRAAAMHWQMVFMDTAATIRTGALAERWKFSSFIVFAFLISMISYPLVANWVCVSSSLR